MKSFSLGVICAALLASCTYVEPVFVTNASPNPILVLFDEREVEVRPGEVKKIRGLHYSGAKIQFPNGDRVSFEKSLKDIIENYSEYDRYICRKFRGSRIDVRFENRTRLELLPCDPADTIRFLRPD